MAKDSDRSAGTFETQKTGGALAGLLAEENEFDRRALWRIGTWGAAAVGAVIVAAMANQSSLEWRRDQIAAVDLARQAQQLQSVAQDSRNETRRLAAAIDTLNSDRDRLYSRVTVLEQGLDSVTGAIARQNTAGTAAGAPVPWATVSSVLPGSATAVADPQPAPADQAALPAIAPVVTAAPAATTPFSSTAAGAAPEKPRVDVAKLEPKPEPKPETILESKSELKPEAKLEPKLEPKAKPEVKPEPKVKLEAKPEPRSAAKSESKWEPKWEPKSKSRTEPKTEQAAAPAAPAPQTASQVAANASAPANPLAPALTTAAHPPPAARMGAASISLMGPPDPAATKLLEPAKAANAGISPAPVADAMASASPKENDSSETASANLPVQRTEFAVDLGSANSVNGLRALWRGLSKSNAELAELRPIIVIKEGNTGLGMQLRLAAGPLHDAAAAARICAALVEGERNCETTVFDGQRLAMSADEAQPPLAAKSAPAAKSLPYRRNGPRQSFNKREESPNKREESPSAKPEPSSSLSTLFGSKR